MPENEITCIFFEIDTGMLTNNQFRCEIEKSFTNLNDISTKLARKTYSRVLINDGCAQWLWLDSDNSEDDHSDGGDNYGRGFAMIVTMTIMVGMMVAMTLSMSMMVTTMIVMTFVIVMQMKVAMTIRGSLTYDDGNNLQ